MVNQSQKTKRSLLTSVIALVLCVSMLLGSTLAWFTDTATAGVQNIVSGKLKVDIVDASGDTLTEGPLAFEKADGHENETLLWEPGVTYELQDFYILNKGNLALKYKMYINGAVGDTKLMEALEFTVKVDGAETDISNFEGSLAKSEKSGLIKISVHMKEDVGNEYQGLKLEGIGITVSAAQDDVEYDSYNNTYDQTAEYSVINHPVNVYVNVPADKIDANNQLTEALQIVGSNGVNATVPAGTKLEAGVTKLNFTVTYMDKTSSNIQLEENEELTSVDVHIAGIAEDNTKPITICLGNMLSTGLNSGNYSLSHVEGNSTNAMTEDNALSVHNQYDYDPATGFVTISIATFSEVVAVVNSKAVWEGSVDISWYTEDPAETDFIIANADQLAGFGAIVGGMNGQERDSFAGKTVKLVSDINLGDKDNADEKLIFHPIGYYYTDDKNEDGTKGDYYSTVYPFAGTFDGNGHKIANFYQNTWEIKGDYDGNYYSDAMGLFGYVLTEDNQKVATIKNLTVDSFSSDGEFTPTGVIAAYAVNSTFENIAITNCNPRVYNTGNGGIVGIGGNSGDPDTYKLKFTNITIDNSNKISALWGSWDVACGGLVGMFRGAGHVYMTNCHVAAQMDVYNDVCGNYQYYWYRYSGMMVGTNKNMTTDANGYTVPETDKFHAENCTVHFGKWNDYYYCELVANSLASYTHDYQFSRLEQITSLDEIKNGDTWTKTGNFLLISGGTKTCYHIVKNADGTLKQHLHTDAGTETVNGETVLKEDKQIVYLPFNQLFTGYGWGVKHIPVYNGKDYAFTEIEILDREVADSVEKFASKDVSTVTTSTVINVGDLFEEADIEDEKLTIRSEQVQVTVSPADNESTVSAKYTADTSDWTKGTLVFDGLGLASITITDYYFCTPKTILVEVEATDKFEVAFDHDGEDKNGNQNNVDKYLYRVGNVNAVSLGSLFEAIDGVEVGNVTATITPLADGVEVSGTYTPNTSDWTKGTIKFSGTGPVAVTIDDNKNANELTLNLEVVNATNITAYSNLGNKNSVLLNNISMSSGGSYYLSGATLYGNGFTFDMTEGAHATGGNISSNYVFGLNNANLDNVKIVGAVYTKYGATVQSDYNRAAILSSGNNRIVNSYISNCASAVRVREGNLELINSTIKGGNFANIDIRGGNVVLDNVTTINQVDGNDTAEDGTVVVGLGVVVYYENVLNTTTIEVKNGITQYNHLSKSQVDDYINDATAKKLTEKMFDTAYAAVQFSDGAETWVNTGILSMTENVGDANISDVAGYVDANPSMTNVTGYLHTKKPDASSVSTSVPEYVSAGQGEIAPSYSFDYTTKNYVAKTDGSNDCCYEENGTVYISMDEGDIFNWDTSILTITKNGQSLDYTVSMNGTDYTGKSIAFSETGEYVVTYTYSDNNNYSVSDEGNILTYSKEYTKKIPITVSVIKATTKHAEFTFGSSNQETEKITVGNNTYISATGVSHDNSTWSYITVNGTKIYYPIVEATIVSKKTAYFNVFKNVVTITDYTDGGTGATVTYNSSTTTMPSGLTVVKGTYKSFADISSNWSTLNDTALTYKGASKVFKYAGSADASSTPTTYSGALCFKSPEVTNSRDEYITMVQYSYTDAANTTYYYYVGYHMAKKGDGSCVTPDTLVTLADGTQKEIQHLTGDEQLLVWNHTTSAFESAPVAYIVNHDDVEKKQEVITLTFNDGSDIEIIGEHVFFDATLNKYVTLDADAAEFIGHKFIKVTDELTALKKVKLVNVKKEIRITKAYEVVTYKNITCFTDGILSASAYLDKILNVFDVNSATLGYNIEQVQQDIETYGLYTYEDFKDLIPKESFEMYNASYLKIAVGKGYITWDDILALIDIYFDVDVKPIQ